MSTLNVNLACDKSWEVCLVCGDTLDSYGEGSGSCTSPLSSSVDTYFILSKVLRLSKELIVKYFESRGGQSPNEWIRFCGSCSENFVSECVRLHKELITVQKQLEKASRRLTDKIQLSLVEGDKKVSGSVAEEIRGFVKSHDYTENGEGEPSIPGGYDEFDSSFSSQFCETFLNTDQSHYKWSSNVTAPSPVGVYVKLEPDVDGTSVAGATVNYEEAPEGPSEFTEEKKPNPRPKRKGGWRKRRSSDSIDEDYIAKDNSSDSDADFASPKRVKYNMKLSWSCDICRDSVPRSSMLEHVTQHVGDYALPCPNPRCPFVYSTINHYNKHVYRTKSKCAQFPAKTFDTCEVCGFQDSSHVAMRTHLQVVHEIGPQPKSLPCPVRNCPEMFSHRQSVQFHITQRHSAPHHTFLMTSGDSSQKCPTCLKMFSQEEIAIHYQDAHDIPLESVTSCKHCSYKAPSRLQLIDHFLVHFQAGMLVPCDLCPESEDTVVYPRLGELRKHYIDEHQIGFTLICEHCSKTFLRKTSLRYHLTNYHSSQPARKREKKFICDLCLSDDPVSFVDQMDLMQHKVKVHGAEPYKCNTCQATFTSWKYLKAHEKNHKKVARKSYPCTIPGCSKICNTPGELENHLNSIRHAGKMNKFVCEECGSGFNTKNNWQVHVNLVHGGKEFVCETCGLGLKSQQSLKRHKLIHTGEKPFACEHCPERFVRKCYLKKHLQCHQTAK